jgi:hypothetical protein
MAIELTNGEIFLHVPKTGGTWVTKTLSELGLVKREVGPMHWDVTRVNHRERLMYGRDVCKHFIRRRISAQYRRKSDQFSTMFTFVRNPFSWYESYWRFMLSHRDNDWHKNEKMTREPQAWWPGTSSLAPLMADNFDDFVSNVVRNRPGFVSELFNLYDQWPVAFVGRQESLISDLAVFLQSRGYNVSEPRLEALPRENASDPKHRNPEWCEELKIQVALTEFSAFIRYGYFDDLPAAVRRLHPSITKLDFGGCRTIAEYSGDFPAP